MKYIYKYKYTIIFKQKFLLIHLFDKLFLKQYYIKNKAYSLFFIYHLLFKFGFVNKIYYIIKL